MADFTMPSLGADMESGKVVEWLVKPGDRVKPGDVVAVVETHKGAIDVEMLPGRRDRRAGAARPGAAGRRGARAGARWPARRPRRRRPRRSPQPAPRPRAPPRRAAAALAAPRRRRARRHARKVSPAARRRAAERGIDADALHGTGVDGAVTLADVELAASQPQPAPAAPGARRARRLRPGADAPGDRRGDGPLEARDPALLPGRAGADAPRARLAARRATRSGRSPSGCCRRCCCSRRWRWRCARFPELNGVSRGRRLPPVRRRPRRLGDLAARRRAGRAGAPRRRPASRWTLLMRELARPGAALRAPAACAARS